MNRLPTALALGAIVFGIAPMLAPRFFARMFGIASADDATVATAIRSVGIRDALIGLGLFRALRAGDRQVVRHWLLARTLSDAGDTLAVSLAVARGARHPRFLGLGGLALGATLVGAAATRLLDAPAARPKDKLAWRAA